jgi:ferritin-like metal-binding protein YciE
MAGIVAEGAEMIEEEKETDQKLTKLAKSAINLGAAAK